MMAESTVYWGKNSRRWTLKAYNKHKELLVPGHGPTDFTPWLRALAKAGYRWYVNPFMHGHPGTEIMAAHLATARDYLKNCHALLRTPVKA